MEAHGFDVDLVLEPRLSARRAWIVASAAGGLSLILATALVFVLPLRETQVFTVLVDRQTGDAENILQVAPTGIEDQEALKQSLLVAYVSDREGYFLAGIQARLESVQRRSTGGAEESLRLLWSKGGGNTAYPPDVYGPGAEVTVTVRRITFLSPNVAQIRFLKTKPDPNSYTYESKVTILETSLDSGLVQIQTCHKKLDPIRKVVILFNKDRIRDIQVRTMDGIAMAEVRDNRVTLSEVQKGGSICIDLQSKALDSLGNGLYQLNAGPLMRRLFDGYLPMTANMKFSWPDKLLAVQETKPASQDGVDIKSANDGLEMDLVFAGKMTAQILLKRSD